MVKSGELEFIWVVGCFYGRYLKFNREKLFAAARLGVEASLFSLLVFM